jgi:hypothetical protein
MSSSNLVQCVLCSEETDDYVETGDSIRIYICKSPTCQASAHDRSCLMCNSYDSAMYTNEKEDRWIFLCYKCICLHSVKN